MFWLQSVASAAMYIRFMPHFQIEQHANGTLVGQKINRFSQCCFEWIGKAKRNCKRRYLWYFTMINGDDSQVSPVDDQHHWSPSWTEGRQGTCWGNMIFHWQPYSATIQKLGSMVFLWVTLDFLFAEDEKSERQRFFLKYNNIPADARVSAHSVSLRMKSLSFE